MRIIGLQEIAEGGGHWPVESGRAAHKDRPNDGPRHAAWFHELDASTRYWDICRPETRGRYYFGDGKTEAGLLSCLLPHADVPSPWTAWKRAALLIGPRQDFVDEVSKPDVAAAVVEMDAWIGRLFARHFGDASDPIVQADYLEAVFRFAVDVLPPSPVRDECATRGPAPDGSLFDGDRMWFAWAVTFEAAQVVLGTADAATGGPARRALLLAGIAMGCQCHADGESARLLRQLGMQWASDFEAAATEVQTLFRVREWGGDGVDA